MATQIRSNHPADAWEPLKDHIWSMYLVENYTIEEIIVKLRMEHDFNVTKSQLETRFKKWNFRKGLAQHEWLLVDSKIKERKRESGKESEVYLSGVPLDSQKVKKAVSRYGSNSTSVLQGGLPPTPEGVDIRTPLPLATIPSRSRPTTLTSTPFHSTRPLYYSLPLTNFFSSFTYGVNPPFHGIRPHVPDLFTQLESMPEITNDNDSELCLTAMHNLVTSTFQSIESSIPQSLISFDKPGTELKPSFSSNPSAILKTFVFMLSNKASRVPKQTHFFAEDEPKKERLSHETINGCSKSGLLDEVLKITGPTAEALLEEFFSAAIEVEDVSDINKILDTGFHPDELRCRLSGGRTVTPLQRACELGSVAVAETLLERGADANKFLKCTLPPLITAISSRHSPLPESHRIGLVKILLKAGACIENHDLFSAASRGLVEITSILLQAGAIQQSPLGKPILRHLLDSFTFTNRTIMVIRALIDAGANTSAITGVISKAMVQYGLDGEVITLIKDLLDRGARATENDLHLAVEADSCAAVTLLVQYGIPITPEIIGHAVRHYSSNIMKILLQSKSSVPHAAIATAVERCTKEEVCLMLRLNVFDPKRQCMTLTAAIQYGKKDIMDMLFAFGVQLERGKELCAAIEDVVRRGDLALLQFLLSDNSPYRSPVVRSLGGSLCLAIRGGQPEMIKLLLEHTSNLDQPLFRRNGSFSTLSLDSVPLMEAIIKQDTTMLQMLLAAGAAVEFSQYETLHSVLPGAISVGDITCIRQLIAAGANPNVRGMSDEKTALIVAIEKGDFDVIKLLMESGADVNALPTHFLALAAAIEHCDIRVVRYLLDMGADPNEPALLAATKSDIRTMHMVMESRLARYKGLSLGFGCNALQYAIAEADTEKIKVLLEYGVNPNTFNNCSHFSNDEGLVDCGCYDLEECESCFGMAIRPGGDSRHGVVRMLLRAGADPNGMVRRANSTWIDSRTSALGSAMLSKDTTMVEILLKAGASTSGKFDVEGMYTALQFAVQCGLVEMVNLLLEHQAEVNAPAYWDHGATALQFAAIGGYLGLASTLLEKGADVDAAGAEVEGRTALEGAAEHGRIDMVQLLINAGAQVTGSGSKQYERAVKFAAANGHRAVRRMLEKIHSEKVTLEESMEAIGSFDGNEWGGVWEM
ncbi:hypothetical protein PV10_01808 [Exophiala mesophila]|uniref:Clr5 domain-containing protein n=1 Tax=Exophiala mesophila TaxID=212818 RepID=A0A0D2AGS0_EXOME|nr:uncharacterized protein PV10_01808 [Exophiala mesophila]KIV98128.1 hypothetical protein PV10_01808 [Exophiala mesophila]